MTNEPRPLLELYKLLWEQIKDKSITGLLNHTLKLQYLNVITYQEMELLDLHILDEKQKLGGFVNSKSFVQRMIAELENEINSSNNSSSSTKANNN